MTIIGIDPGATGALAILDGLGLDVVDMPMLAGHVHAHALAAQLIAWGPVDRVCVEHQQAYPRQGISSAFKTGEGFGIIVGVLAVLERPVVFVTASQWTKFHRVGADKDVHRRRACELWPASADYFSRKKDDGRADAALIAAWCASQPSELRPVVSTVPVAEGML